MADLKISQLTAITTLTPATDVLPVVDVTGTTKKITTNQILGAGGTATLASATITGALAANADTTLGTASKSTNTNLNFSSDLGTQRIYIDRGTRSLVFQDVTSSIENYRIAGITGVHTWGVGGSTAMTLNSTGLGVGISPSYKLNIGAANPTGGNIAQFYNNATSSLNGAFCLITQFGVQDWYMGQPAGVSAFTIGTGTTSKSEFFRIDGSGNVGIGVTPSAWSAYKALQIGRGSFSSDTSSATAVSTLFGSNFVYDGNWKYIVAAAATFYQQTGGVHYWFNEAGTKAAGATFTPVQAMTLDASGNLLVGFASNPNTARAYFRYDTLTTQPVINSASIVAASTSWSHFIGQSGNGSSITTSNIFIYGNGDIQNVNGVYGTISDLRLKENIADARNYLADLLKLRVVKYSLKEEASAVANKLGLIAQEVEQVFPAMVDTDPNTGNKGIKTSVLIPMLVKAIQELTARVQTLEAK